MPLDRTATALPLDVADDYGLSELGQNHRSLDEIYAAIGAARSWWVCTSRPSSRPHAVPVWGVVVDDHMLFCSDPTSVKTRNLDDNPHVTVHLESGDDVVIVEGVVHNVAPNDLPADFVANYESKYAFAPDPHAPSFTTHEVRPTKILAWDEADFAATAARWLFT